MSFKKVFKKRGGWRLVLRYCPTPITPICPIEAPSPNPRDRESLATLLPWYVHHPPTTSPSKISLITPEALKQQPTQNAQPLLLANSQILQIPCPKLIRAKQNSRTKTYLCQPSLSALLIVISKLSVVTSGCWGEVVLV